MVSRQCDDDSVLAHCRQTFLAHTTAVGQLPWRSLQVSICCWDVAGIERVAQHTIAAARCLLAGCSYAFVDPGDHEMLHRSAQHRGSWLRMFTGRLALPFLLMSNSIGDLILLLIGVVRRHKRARSGSRSSILALRKVFFTV